MRLPSNVIDFIEKHQDAFMAFETIIRSNERQNFVLYVTCEAFYGRNNIKDMCRLFIGEFSTEDAVINESHEINNAFEKWYENTETLVRVHNETDYFCGDFIYLMCDKFDLSELSKTPPIGALNVNIIGTSSNSPFLVLGINGAGSSQQKVRIYNEYFSYFLNNQNTESADIFLKSLKSFVDSNYNSKIKALEEKIKEIKQERNIVFEFFSDEDKLLFELL